MSHVTDQRREAAVIYKPRIAKPAVTW